MTDQPFVDHCTAPVDIEQALKKTAQRFERQEARKIERGATYVARAEGKAVCEALLPDLAKFMLSPKAQQASGA